MRIPGARPVSGNGESQRMAQTAGGAANTENRMERTAQGTQSEDPVRRELTQNSQ